MSHTSWQPHEIPEELPTLSVMRPITPVRPFTIPPSTAYKVPNKPHHHPTNFLNPPRDRPPPPKTHRLARAIWPNHCHPAAEPSRHIHIRQPEVPHSTIFLSRRRRLAAAAGCTTTAASSPIPKGHICQLADVLLFAVDAVKQARCGEPEERRVCECACARESFRWNQQDQTRKSFF